MVEISERFAEMEGIVSPAVSSVWIYQERIEELMVSLEYTKSELEYTKIIAMEERIRNEEHVNKLLELLTVTRRERDEARDQLQGLLEKIIQTNPTGLCNSFPSFKPETPPVQQTKGNSSFAESESYVSSPIGSIFETVSSPELPNMADSSNTQVLNQSFVRDQEVLGSNSNAIQFDKDLTETQLKNSRTVSSIDFRKVKSLPERGKFLQAVMEAGPLLQTLLVAGPLPRWKNPPPLHPLQVPTISSRSPNSATLIQNLPQFQNSPSLPHDGSFYGASQVYSTSLHCSSSSSMCVNKRPSLSNSTRSLKGKQQKIQ